MESVVTIRAIVLCVLVWLFLITTSIEAQQFTFEPESVVQAEGLLAKFECLSPGALGHFWFVDGIVSTSPDFSPEIRVAGGTSGNTSVLTIPARSQFSNSVIQCAAASLSGGVLSRNATLKVERVSIDVLNERTNITVSMTNNLTINMLAFRVDISLTTLGTNEMVTLPPLNGGQNQTQFHYKQHNNHTVCDIFSFTVTPISRSGMEGKSSEPVAGFFTQVTDNNNVTPLISQGGNVLRKIVHLGGMVPNCTNFTSYQVNSDISAPINKTIKDPQMINFSLPTDRIINISVTLTSITGVRLIFKDIRIRTTDVQDLIVDVCPNRNCASIKYVEGTLSPGALVCVIRIIDGELDFASIRLVPIRRNLSDSFTIPVAVSGKYSVVAFDLENNDMSAPRIPMSLAADNETMFLSNESPTEPNSPPNSEGITVTKLSNGNAEVTCTTTGQSCLALFQSKTSETSLDPMVVGLIEPPNDRTNVTLNATSDVYVVVYTWNSDSGETIFNGKVSFISQLELPTSPPPSPTQSPPDTTESLAPPPKVRIVIVVLVMVLVSIAIILIVVLCLVKRCNKVPHSSYNHCQLESSQGKSTNRASRELSVGASKTSREELIVPLYDVARVEYMSPEFNTLTTDDVPPLGYDVICKENMQVEYETIPLVQAGKPTPTTSDNPPPLPPPMIRGDSEAPDLPPPYNPAMDSESVVVMLAESSLSRSAENQSVDVEVDESLKIDLSASDMEHDGTTEEAISNTNNREMGQILDVACLDTVQGAEDGAGNSADCGGQKAMIVAQDVGASITLVPVATYDIARPENMSLECNTADTDDTPPPGYDVVCKENMQSPEYETIALAAPTTSENPPPLPPPTIQGDEGLENAVMLTEEATSISQAKDEPTEDGGDDGLEAMITAQHQYTLVVPKPASSDAKVKDSSKVIYSEVDKNKLKPVVPPPVAKTQGQYIPVETRPASSDAKVMDSTKVVYVVVDKDKLKPVDPNDPPALPPRHPVTNTEELHTETTLALPPRQRPPPPPPTHETLMDLLHPVDKKWEDIAKALNIDEDRVDEIFTNNENEYLRLYELMEYYFTNVHCSHSWEEMVQVLTEIGEHGLAGRIKADKIQGGEVLHKLSSVV